jgi:hypothetical protein
MELYVLDIEGTKEEIVLNGGIDTDKEKAFEKLEDILGQVDLGIENTIKHIGSSYITSKNNVSYYKEEYGWIFSKVVIANL